MGVVLVSPSGGVKMTRKKIGKKNANHVKATDRLCPFFWGA
jgi:hypothetical protein